jgi:hypothetical protein
MFVILPYFGMLIHSSITCCCHPLSPVSSPLKKCLGDGVLLEVLVFQYAEKVLCDDYILYVEKVLCDVNSS